MDCPFCHHHATLTAYGDDICDFECQSCRATYICDRYTAPHPHEYHSAKFFTMYEGKKYTVYFDWKRRYSYLEYNAPNLVDYQIAMWDFIPNLNPQNIQSKIKTLLTFS